MNITCALSRARWTILRRTSEPQPGASVGLRTIQTTASWLVLIFYFLVSGTPITALAQVSLGTGSIEGTVEDASGAVMPNAKITVTNIATQESRGASSDPSGRYYVLSLPVGTYEVKAEASGFRTAIRQNVVLVIGRTAVVNFEMKVGEITETVTVSAAPPLIESSNATIGEVVENKQILALPLNGRSYAQLTLLIPQVVQGGVGTGIGSGLQDTAIGTRATVSISGSRREGNQFSYNGINVTNEFTGGTYIYPPIDSLQEFKIEQNNYSAELGGRAGQVLLTAKAGTNEFHGSVYEFLRNDQLDANNFFNNLAGRKIAPLRQNQFGAALGGPVYKNKTFFFANYEGGRVRRGSTSTTTLPTARMRTGDFSELLPDRVIRDPVTGAPFSGNIIPTPRLSPIALNTVRLSEYPLPNLSGLRNNYTVSPVNKNDLDQINSRVDHSFSEKDKLWGSFYWTKLDTASPRFTQINDSLQQTTAQAWSVDYTHIFSPHLINNLRGGFNYVSQDIKNRTPQDITNAQLGFPQNEQQPQAFGISAGIPSFSPSGYGSTGAAAGPPQLFKTRHFQVADTVNWIKGSHVMKFGVDITREHEDQRFNPQIRGNYSFGGSYSNDGFSDFLLGLPTSATRDLVGLGQDIFESLHRGTHYYFFAQDDWKATPNLTLNLGLRYEFNDPVVEARDRMANYLPRVVSGVGRIVRIQAPDPEFGRSLVRAAKNDWGPRLGLAYRPGGSTRTAIRAGYGVFYAYVPYNTKQTLSFNGPWVTRHVIANTVPTPSFDLANSFPSNLITGSALSGFSSNIDNLDAMIQNWNLSIQREVAKSILVDVNYVGSLSVHLDQNPSLNVAGPGEGPFGPRRPFPNEPAVVAADNGSTATYHAFTIKVKKEFDKGLMFLAHYTESKSIDNNSSQLSDLQDHNDIRSNKGLAGHHVPHRFVATALYDLPFGRGKKYLASSRGVVNALLGGWSVNGIYTLQSGFFFSPTTSRNTANSERGCCRADRLRDGNLPSSERTRLKWFDTGAFVQPAPFRYGNAGRDILEGPGLKNFDLGLIKNTSIREGHVIQFRAEFFNAWNNVNFGLPDSNIASGAYGTISSAGFSREIQFGLKYIF
jgi:Carboxypeptidase regulatory-like domain/TonB dependent receptor-like, beta-barrel